MFCPYCGQQMRDGTKFCPKCGRPMDDLDMEELIVEEPEPAPMVKTQSLPKHAQRTPSKPLPNMKPRELYDKYETYDEDEYYSEQDDPMEKLRSRTVSTYQNVSRKVNQQIASRSLQSWQIISCGTAIASIICLLISLFSGAAYALMGMLSSGLMIFFMLRKPKFGDISMLFPATYFAMMYGAIGLQAASGFNVRGFSIFTILSAISEFASGGDWLGGLYNRVTFGTAPFDLFVRLLLYALVVVYFLTATGRMRQVDIACYIMLGICAVVAIYDVVNFFRYISMSFGLAIFQLGSLAFVVSFTFFIMRSPKPKRMKGGRNNTNWQLVSSLLRVIPSEYANYDFSPYHPFYSLGGWLLTFVIFQYISAVWGIIQGIISIIRMSGSLLTASIFGTESFSGLLIILLDIAYTGLTTYLDFKLPGKIRRRDTTFLLLYHVNAIISLSVSMMIGCAYNGFWAAIGSLILPALGIFLCTLYYRKSVRVRTFMLSDEYLRLSPFTKNVQAPKPIE